MAGKKISTGLNERPKEAAGGFPDDSGKPVDVNDEKIEATSKKLTDDPLETW